MYWAQLHPSYHPGHSSSVDVTTIMREEGRQDDQKSVSLIYVVTHLGVSESIALGQSKYKQRFSEME